MADHICPAPGCEVPVSYDMLTCRSHWYSIPKPIRDRVWRAYKGPGPGSEEHTAAIDEAIEYLRAA